jgi:hypothetical protein
MWGSLYYFWHVVCIIAMVVLPSKDEGEGKGKAPKAKTAEEKKTE